MSLPPVGLLVMPLTFMAVGAGLLLLGQFLRRRGRRGGVVTSPDGWPVYLGSTTPTRRVQGADVILGPGWRDAERTPDYDG